MDVNPWVRANLEQYSLETLELLPIGEQETYTRIMKELAHSKAIATLALERVYLFEQERAEFFRDYTNTSGVGLPD